MNRATTCATLAGAFALLLAPPVCAQTPGSGYVPSLGEAIPLEVREGRVVLAESLLAAPGRILPAGMIARLAFARLEPKQIEAARRTKKDELLETYDSRQVGISAINPEDDRRTAEEKAMDLRATAPAWSEPIKFLAMFHSRPTDSYFIALQSTPEAKPEIVQFRFPDQIVMTGRDGVIRIRAVGVDSNAAKSGLGAGMELLRIGSTPLNGDLALVVRTLAREREAAQLAGKPLELEVRTPEGPTRLVALRTPRSLKDPNDLFSDLTTPSATNTGNSSTPLPAPSPAP